MNIDNGVTGIHTSIYKTTGYNGYLEDSGLAANDVGAVWYTLQANWDEPVGFTLGMDAVASARKTFSNLKAEVTMTNMKLK
jgi:hypothetical protein